MKPHDHLQAGDVFPEKQMNSERIIRRMVLECILPLAEWAENQPELTRQMIQGTARRKSLYEEGQGWEKVLADFIRRDIEIIRLEKPLNLPRLMERGDGEIARRLDELGDLAEDTLLACWHQDHGLLVVTWPDTDSIPTSIQPKRKLLIPIDGELAAVWVWSKHNFPEYDPR